MPQGVDDVGATQRVAAEAALLGHRLGALPRPAADLPGWESAAADGYARAVRALGGAPDGAAESLARAVRAG